MRNIVCALLTTLMLCATACAQEGAAARDSFDRYLRALERNDLDEAASLMYSPPGGIATPEEMSMAIRETVRRQSVEARRVKPFYRLDLIETQPREGGVIHLKMRRLSSPSAWRWVQTEMILHDGTWKILVPTPTQAMFEAYQKQLKAKALKDRISTPLLILIFIMFVPVVPYWSWRLVVIWRERKTATTEISRRDRWMGWWLLAIFPLLWLVRLIDWLIDRLV